MFVCRDEARSGCWGVRYATFADVDMSMLVPMLLYFVIPFGILVLHSLFRYCVLVWG